MSNNVKNVESSSEEDEDESEEEEEEQARAANTKIQVKTQERQPQEEEESSSEEEDSETDNEAQRYNTVRREATPAAVKTAHSANLVGKRVRDGELKDEGPAPKKNKESRGDRGKVPVKPASPSRTNKADLSSKESKAQVSKAKSEKNKPQPVERDEHTKASAANKKRKVSPPPPVNGSSKHRTDATDKNSPLKPKTPFMWTSNLEIALATMLWNDKKHGRPIPSGTKNDPYWAKLVKELSSEGVTITEAQLSEKVRRMKNKWKALKEKQVENPWRNPHEQKMFGIWDGIWGTGVVSEKQPSRPATAHGTPNEEEEDEFSEEEEEEEEEEDVGTPAVGVSRVAVQPSRKEESAESEDEDEEEEEERDVPPKKSGMSHDGPSKEGTAFSPTAVVSPFVSKPRLEYTPILPKDKKKARKGEEASIAEQNGTEESAEEEDRNGQTSTAVAELLNSLKKESFTILHEVRTSCLDALNNIRKQTTTVLDDMKDTNSRLGVMPTSGIWRMNSGTVPPVDRGFLEELRAGTSPSMTPELKGQWRKLRVEEMDLLERRINLTLKQLQLARKEFQEQDN